MSTILDDPIEKPICKVVSFNLRILDFVLHTSVRIGIYLQCLSNEKKTDEYRDIQRNLVVFRPTDDLHFEKIRHQLQFLV